LREARYEVFSAPWLGNLLSETLVAWLNSSGGAQPSNHLAKLWQKNLSLALPEAEISHFSAAERYRLRRVELTLEALERELVRFDFSKQGESVLAEENLVFSLEGVSHPLRARVDARAGDALLEFKLTSRSVFKGTQGKRAKGASMLNKILDSSSPDAARYGFQILFYLAYAKVKKQSHNVFLINPYWEISSSNGKSPMIYGWSNADELEDLLARLQAGARLYIEGITADDSSAVFFPFYPHEKRGERCDFCSYQTLCLKDVPYIRAANQNRLKVLKDFHGE
jgi:hypothetical protein